MDVFFTTNRTNYGQKNWMQLKTQVKNADQYVTRTTRTWVKNPNIIHKEEMKRIRARMRRHAFVSLQKKMLQIESFWKRFFQLYHIVKFLDIQCKFHTTSYRFSKVVDLYQDELDWAQLDLASQSNVLEVWNASQYWSANKKLTASMWWILFWGLAERRTPAQPQFNSSCLEINNFRKTVTDSVNLTIISTKWLKNSFFLKIQWYHQNWKA